jgi:hypothetical protein
LRRCARISIACWPGFSLRQHYAMTDPDDLCVPFSLRGISGLIAVSVTRNTDPDTMGYSLLAAALPTDAARGFPVCHATVTYPAQGYAAMFGWTQIVRSTDSAPDRFEMDPIALYQQIPLPTRGSVSGLSCSTHYHATLGTT